MRRYETIVIIDPDLPEGDRTSLLDRVKEIIAQQEGVLIQEDLWGIKKMAYEIKRKPRGFYARMDFCGMSKVVDELERFCRIDDRVMKYLTVLLNPEADVEKIKAEIAAAQAPAVTQESEATATAQVSEGQSQQAQESDATPAAQTPESQSPQAQESGKEDDNTTES
jgi:small subunit ribosomal protein S6